MLQLVPPPLPLALRVLVVPVQEAVQGQYGTSEHYGSALQISALHVGVHDTARRKCNKKLVGGVLFAQTSAHIPSQMHAATSMITSRAH